MKPYIIGICGGSGSGKTTLLKKIKSTLGNENVSVFTMDNYYLPKEVQARDKNDVVNFDLPTALNEKQLCLDLKKIIGGEEIQVKEYFFNAPVNDIKKVSIVPNKVIIVEGLFLFYFKEVREALDFSIYVDVDPKHQLARRINRDQKTRGYSKEDIEYQWNEHVVPCYNKYILPFKPNADFVFRNDDHAGTDLKRLKKELKTKQ
ncbi:MAG: AAA family ATPase [Crocinitomicaceae bacterium]|jgi:uridine kinase|tara:strand:+ start:3036 stop:3647 length:612 start_codon:yes stop_codon:yes gene_type:complete